MLTENVPETLNKGTASYCLLCDMFNEKKNFKFFANA